MEKDAVSVPWIDDVIIQGEGCVSQSALEHRLLEAPAPNPPAGLLVVVRQTEPLVIRVELIWGAEQVGERTLSTKGESCDAVLAAVTLLITTALESVAVEEPEVQATSAPTQVTEPSGDEPQDWTTTNSPEDSSSSSAIGSRKYRYRVNVRTGAAALISNRIEPLLQLRMGAKLLRRDDWAFELDGGVLATWGVPRSGEGATRTFSQTELYATTLDGCFEFLHYGLACAGLAGGVVRTVGELSGNEQFGPWMAVLSGLHARIPMGSGGMVLGVSGSYAPVLPTFAREGGGAMPRWGRLFTWGIEYAF